MFNPTRSLSLSLSLFLYSSFSSRQQICEEGTQHRRVIGRLAIAYNSGSVNVSSIQSVSGIKVLSVLQGLPIIHRVALSKAIDRIFRRQRVVYICVYIYNVCVCVYICATIARDPSVRSSSRRERPNGNVGRRIDLFCRGDLIRFDVNRLTLPIVPQTVSSFPFPPPVI